MQKENALRHLLLRHLWLRRRLVEPVLYSEVTRSLTIARDHSGFLISWTRLGARHEQRCGPDDYLLYVRGDSAGASGADGSDQRNEALASKLADEALIPLPADSSDWKARSLHPRMGVSVGGAVLLGLSLAAIGLPAAGALMASLFLLEFAGPAGKALAAAGFAGFVALAFPATAALGAAAYALLQFLDPNSNLRAARVGLALAAAAWASFHLLSGTGPLHLRDAASLVIPCGVLLYFRWMCGSHFRSLPLVLPVIAIGLAADASAPAAAVAVAGSVISALCARYAHLLLPVRSPETAFRETMVS